MTPEETENPKLCPPKSKIVAMDNLSSMGAAKEPQPYEYGGKTFYPSSNSHWEVIYPDGLDRLAKLGRLYPIGNSLMYVRCLDDFPAQNTDNIWNDTSAGGFSGTKVYVVQTNVKVIERCLLMTTDPGDLVFDPTCVRKGTQVWVVGGDPLESPRMRGDKRGAPLSSMWGDGILAPSPQAERAGKRTIPIHAPSPFTGRTRVG
jgi:adenine-specific DNA-methyltransferase